jgi:hypothetical protein
VGTGERKDIAHWTEAMSINPAAVLSVVATAAVAIAFLLMLEESLALRAGRDPFCNGMRAVVRRIPRSTYALAVVIGMVLGHLLWP